MGQHTWFVKDRTIHKKVNELYDKSEELADDEAEDHDEEIERLIIEADQLYKDNKTDYHDLFRTNKRNKDGTYTDDELYSYAETLKWLIDNDEFVNYQHTIFDTPEQIKQYRQYCYEQIPKFWEEFPNGAIYFG